MTTKMHGNIKECHISLACPSLWTCRVSFTSAKQKIHPLKSTVLHLQKPSLNPPVDISHEWMLQRCQEHLGLLNFLLFSHHTPLTVCKNQQQHKDPPAVRAAAFPKPWDSWLARGFQCYSPRYGNIATSTLGGVLYAHTVYLHDAGPPRFTQPDGV